MRDHEDHLALSTRHLAEAWSRIERLRELIGRQRARGFPTADAEPGLAVEGQSHAWVQYWAGSWCGIDATNHTVPGPRHVLVGHGRDYGDVLPHKGIYHGAPDSDLTVSVRFTRLA